MDISIQYEGFLCQKFCAISYSEAGSDNLYNRLDRFAHVVLQCRILKSWIRARINECMSYCTKMNEWPFFIIITRSTMQTFAKFKIVVLCISVSFYWDLINDWISMMRWYFFFLFRILYLNGVNFQHCIYNLLHVDSWKCNIFRAQSTDWNYSSGAHSTKRAELKAASE